MLGRWRIQLCNKIMKGNKKFSDRSVSPVIRQVNYGHACMHACMHPCVVMVECPKLLALQVPALHGFKVDYV